MGILNTYIRIIRHRNEGHKNLKKLYFEKNNSISLRLERDNRFPKFCIESYVRGFHVYQIVWSPIIGEENLDCRDEEKNEDDEFAIGVYRNDFQKETSVGHMPGNISKFVYKFLKFPNSKFSCKLKGKRLNRGAGYCLEIPVIYTFNGHEKAIEWIKSKI